jgi:uncharacterized protein (UPF0332 family)
MSLPHDLLEQANHLANREKKRPRQASLRRSISTSYYALFHLLTTEATVIVGTNMTPAAREGMARWFNHGEMKRVCNFFSAATAPTNKDAPKQLSSMLAGPVSADLQSVASAFIQLQEARHDADYNLTRTWTRLTAQQYVDIARRAFEAWARLKKSHEANVFAIALISIKLFDRER